MTALASGRGADQLGNMGALTDGYSAAFLGAAGIAIAGGLVAAVTLRRPNGVAPDTTSSDQPERELVTA